MSIRTTTQELKTNTNDSLCKVGSLWITPESLLAHEDTILNCGFNRITKSTFKKRQLYNDATMCGPGTQIHKDYYTEILQYVQYVKVSENLKYYN